MSIAGVKVKRDPALVSGQNARTALDGPVPRERPLVESQRIGDGIAARLVEHGSLRRREVPALLVADVRLGRAQVQPVGLRLEAPSTACTWLVMPVGTFHLAIAFASVRGVVDPRARRSHVATYAC